MTGNQPSLTSSYWTDLLNIDHIRSYLTDFLDTDLITFYWPDSFIADIYIAPLQVGLFRSVKAELLLIIDLITSHWTDLLDIDLITEKALACLWLMFCVLEYGIIKLFLMCAYIHFCFSCL